MKVLSLFDGISCARVALDKAGIPVQAYLASEIDKYSITVSKKNYPDIMHIGDVEKIYIGEDAEIDLLIGGSPCQDLSIAGARKGLAGERSKLFWEYVRILKETKPKYFILENVASMSSHVRDTISEILGVQPIMIDAALVSAQQRKRYFWTNIPGVTLPADKGILLKDILEYGDVDRDKAYCIDASYYKGANWLQYKTRKRRQLVKVGYLGTKDSQANRIYSPEGKSATLSALGGGGGGKTGLYRIVTPVALRNRGEGKKPEYRKDEKANALTTTVTGSMVAQIDGEDYVVRKPTPVECERLQCLPDNYTEGVSNTRRYMALGNAFNADVIAHILSFVPESDKA